MNTKELGISFYALLRKEVVRFLRMWPQTFLPPLVTVALYFIIFGNFIGGKIGEMGGIPFIDFIVPGLVLMTVINSAFANVVGSFYIAKFQRELEAQLVSPMPIWLIIAGYVCGGVMRGVVSAILVLFIALFFWEPHFYNIGIVLLFLLLASLVFSLAGLLNGIFAKKFDDVAMFASFLLTPMTYLGGVFFSLDALSPTWKSISLLNPIWYMMSGFRYGFYGVSDVGLSTGIGILILLAAILCTLNGYLLQRGFGIKE